MELFLAMVLAHVLADFLLQGPGMVQERARGRPRGYLLHLAGHSAALILLTHPYLSPALAALWVLLPAAHLLIDWSKDRLFPARHPAGALVFLLDQALHLLMLFGAWQWTAPPLNPSLASFYRGLLTPAGRAALHFLTDGGAASILLVAAVYGFVILGGAVLVRKVLDRRVLRLPDPVDSSSDPRRAGRYIGMLERAVILSLALANAFTAVAFVLTAKSIARYRELADRDFAEYYLAGTLLSTLLAILGGLLIRSALA